MRWVLSPTFGPGRAFGPRPVRHDRRVTTTPEASINIQQLRYVVATAEHGSMTAAAAALYVAQPALSRAVRLLEHELGLTLFRRSGRGAVLTADGEVFLTGARRVLGGLEDLRGIGDRATPDAELVIAATPTLQASMAVPILAAVQEQGIRMHTRLLGAGSTAKVHELVAAGRADLGICDQTLASDLATVPLGRAEVRLVSPPGLALPDPITIADLAGVPMVLPTQGTERRVALDWFFSAHGVEQVIAIESDERSVWLESVLAGIASCIWHSVDALRVPEGRIESRGFEPAIFQDLSAVHREDPSPATKVLLDVLRQLAELAGG
jgi:DNA-binding transcriptional LysR family regulator